MYELPSDIISLFGSFIIGIIIGAFHSRMGTHDKPIWPIKLYLGLFTYRQPDKLKEYAKSRHTFSLREQFLASAFIWFFIIYMVLMFFLGGFRGYGDY